MNVLALLLAVTAYRASDVDSLAVYSAVLQQVRNEFPAHAIVLAETRSEVACMPICGAALRDPGGTAEPAPRIPKVDHSPALLARLRERGLIAATCVVPELHYGCADNVGRLFVALGEIAAAPAGGPAPEEGAVWVKVAFLVPCVRDCPTPGSESRHVPDAFGYWYLLRADACGSWTIVRRAPGFAV
jgi:hypothetical protein